jgi:hypothetical protein
VHSAWQRVFSCPDFLFVRAVRSGVSSSWVLVRLPGRLFVVYFVGLVCVIGPELVSGFRAGSGWFL